MKRFIVCFAVLSLILSGIVFAADGAKQKNESTIVGPVMENRYVQMNPDDEQTQDALSKPAQKLMDQGVIPAVEHAKVNSQKQGVKK